MSISSPSDNSTSSTPSPVSNRPLLALWDESPPLIALAFLCALIAIGTNSFLIALIICTRKLRQLQVNCYIALLAIADLIIGISIPMRSTYMIYTSSRGMTTYPRLMCSFVNIVKAFGFTMTRIVVLTIALDRFYVVVRPLSYKGRFKPSLFLLVLFLSLAVPSLDVSLKYVGMQDLWALVPICSLNLARGPYSETFATPFTYSCLALLIVIYLPFLVVYLWKTKFTQKQVRTTTSVIWLILFYLFHWGFSYAVDLAKSSLMALLGDQQFLANSDLSVYSSFFMGWVGNLSSTVAFFNYMWKHEELRKASGEFWAKFGKSAKKMLCKYSSNKVIELKVNSMILQQHHSQEPTADRTAATATI